MTRLKRIMGGLSAAGLALGASSQALAEWGLNLTEGVTPISRDVYGLHMLIIWICVGIAVVVFGAMFWSILHHRKSKGVVPAQFHESTSVEVVWTVIPFLILVGMAIPATKTLIAMEDVSNPDMTVKVTGYQWKWRYEYLDDEVDFFSSLDAESTKIRNGSSDVDPAEIDNYLLNVDNPLVVPTNTRIRFVITAADVIHAWWVPALGWKKDAIPGFVNEAWTYIEEPGVYRGQCAELCGRDHGYMPIVVEAVSADEYKEWVSAQKAVAQVESEVADQDLSQDDLIARGEKVYNAQCAACHQANGQGMAGVFPAIAGSPVATGPSADHIDLILNGKAGTAMAGFADQLSDLDLAAVITYQRNGFGNATGDTVQPSDIKAAR